MRNEMRKLERMLTNAHIPFERNLDITGGLQICYPSCENCVCDAICHSFSYGGNEGLLEIMGLVECEDDSVEGYLTAAEVFNRIKKDYYSRKINS